MKERVEAGMGLEKGYMEEITMKGRVEEIGNEPE